ncbi:condensation domain-containing protein [Streptomyces flaveolus]|uniref:condensation domain-containing protein n=1 Tax=Streptomyces flaveolus TaxID=67297 RepID=UPI0033E96575
MRATVLDAAAHQEFPFVELVRAVRPPRDLSANPLFQVMFSFHDTPVEDLSMAGAPVRVLEHANGTAKTDLNVIVIPHGVRRVGSDGFADDRIAVLWEYSSDLFDEATMRELSDTYTGLLHSLVTAPDAAWDRA